MNLDTILSRDNLEPSQPDTDRPEQSEEDKSSPEVFWIGCSDTRVPPSKISGLPPENLFIHQNMANLALGADTNYLSALEYAVNGLNVEDIVVCGHSDCDAITAVTGDHPHDYLDDWIQEIYLTHRANSDELNQIENSVERRHRLSELNVIQQVNNIAGTRILRTAWDNDRSVTIHGLIFDDEDGQLDDVLRDVTEPR